MFLPLLSNHQMLLKQLMFQNGQLADLVGYSRYNYLACVRKKKKKTSHKTCPRVLVLHNPLPSPTTHVKLHIYEVL